MLRISTTNLVPNGRRLGRVDPAAPLSLLPSGTWDALIKLATKDFTDRLTALVEPSEKAEEQLRVARLALVKMAADGVATARELYTYNAWAARIHRTYVDLRRLFGVLDSVTKLPDVPDHELFQFGVDPKTGLATNVSLVIPQVRGGQAFAGLRGFRGLGNPLAPFIVAMIGAIAVALLTPILVKAVRDIFTDDESQRLRNEYTKITSEYNVERYRAWDKCRDGGGSVTECADVINKLLPPPPPPAEDQGGIFGRALNTLVNGALIGGAVWIGYKIIANYRNR